MPTNIYSMFLFFNVVNTRICQLCDKINTHIYKIVLLKKEMYNGRFERKKIYDIINKNWHYRRIKNLSTITLTLYHFSRNTTQLDWLLPIIFLVFLIFLSFCIDAIQNNLINNVFVVRVFACKCFCSTTCTQLMTARIFC